MTDGYHIGPSAGSILLRTYRDGMAAAIGHDLVLEVTDWSGIVSIDPARPEASNVRVSVQVASLRVREGTGGAKPLTQKDTGDIEKNLQKVLQAGAHPQLVFESTALRFNSPRGKGVISGQLTIAGTARQVEVEIEVTENTSGRRVRGRGVVTQSDFGIKPYSALLGALKVKDDVEVDLDLQLRKTPQV